MIVCRKCSRRVADGTEFCACGAFLEFDGEHVADPVGSQPTAAPVTPMTTTRSAVPVSDPPAARPEPVSQRTSPTAEPAPWSGLPGESTWDARQPAAEPSSGVDARLPDTPVNTPGPAPVWVDANLRPGEVPCARCSTPNGPERQFCKHCGAPLAGAQNTVQLDGQATGTSWWQRFRLWARRKTGRVDAASLATTARRMSTGGPTTRTVAFRSGALMIVGATLLAFFGPWQTPIRAGARRLMAGDRYTAIPNADIRVESIPAADNIVPAEFPQQEETNVIDGFANTSWATRWVTSATPGGATVPTDGTCDAPSGTDSALRFTLTEKPDLDRIRILGGRYADHPARKEHSRPRLVELRFGDDCKYAELADDGKLTAIPFAHGNVEQVELRIVDIFKDDELSHTVEISEVVFERRR